MLSFSQKLLCSHLVKPLKFNLSRSMSSYSFETLKINIPHDFVYHVQLNRPDKRNAMNQAFWSEMVDCFEGLTRDENCRSVVVSGAGAVFTAGLDLSDMGNVFMAGKDGVDVGRRARNLLHTIRSFQRTFTVIEECPKPVIAAVHGACVGGGVDLVTACDIRYATKDAWFQVKEVDIGLAADVGTLQRLPKVVGSDSLARELVYTARRLPADEALACGLVSRVLADKEELLETALSTARTIAERSPIAVQGSKESLVYSRDHSVPEGLEHVAIWNQCMLQSEDVMNAAMSSMAKQKPVFPKL